MESIGYKFQPEDMSGMQRRMNQTTGQAGPMASQALRILSLRLPSMLGGRPLSTRSMMTPGMGGQGPLSVSNPGSSNLQSLITGAVGGSGSPTSSSPVFTPGTTGQSAYSGPIGEATSYQNPSSGPMAWTGPMAGSATEYQQPYNPGDYTGPVTGGVTGQGGNGQDYSWDSVLGGLMQLFGNRG